jgi:alpha-glucosidase
MDHLALPHHDGSALYVDDSAPDPGATVSVRVRVPAAFGARAVHLRTVLDGEPAFYAAEPDGGDAHETWFRALLRMHSPVMNYRWLIDRGDDGYAWLNGTGVHSHDVTDSADFRIATYDAPPAWSVDAVVYQIFPDRFAKSVEREAPEWAVPARWDEPVVHVGPVTPRQLYGGDLAGIEQHLDHLQDLGVTTVYLTPIFPAESNHRYNASSFEEVDPLLGGDEALVSLAEAVHQRGMRILADLTTNHSGDHHTWFITAQKDPDAPEKSFYYWREHPSDYEAWMGVRSLPKFNLASPELRRRLIEGEDSVVARWLQEPYDLDGWRIDVANMTGRFGADEFNNEVARTIRATMAAAEPETLLIAEHCHDATADLTGDGWHGTMNYAGFTRPVWAWLNGGTHGLRFLGMPVGVPTVSAAAAVRTMREFSAVIPWRSVEHNLNLLGSHDTPRIRTIVGDAARQAVAAGLLLTYVGIPMVFMGDELGLEGLDGEHSRTPMPWHDTEVWKGETAQTYRDLIALRRGHDALRRGGLRWVLVEDDAIAFLRETADERLLVLAARSSWDGASLPSLGRFDDAVNVYGALPLGTDASGAPVLPGEGPTFQVWRARSGA